jgi:hypothetical protein
LLDFVLLQYFNEEFQLMDLFISIFLVMMGENILGSLLFLFLARINMSLDKDSQSK